MHIDITASHFDFLRDNKIFLNSEGRGRSWLKLGSRYNTFGAALIEPYTGMFAGPRLCSMGSFSYSKSYFPPQYVAIGRYCAIAQKSQMIPDNHPVERLSMCGFDYSNMAPFANFEADIGAKVPKASPKSNVGTTIIGNDVWIGQEVMIKRGVTIGNGAVIGARSIVTRDVEPYAIVAGSPARTKRMRFSDDLIERLQASEWWRYSYDQFSSMNTANPLEFLPAFEDAKAAGKLSVKLDRHVDVHAAFRDISTRHATEAYLMDSRSSRKSA